MQTKKESYKFLKNLLGGVFIYLRIIKIYSQTWKKLSFFEDANKKRHHYLNIWTWIRKEENAYKRIVTNGYSFC
jgi:hypothetical protein